MYTAITLEESVNGDLVKRLHPSIEHRLHTETYQRAYAVVLSTRQRLFLYIIVEHRQTVKEYDDVEKFCRCHNPKRSY